MATRKIQMIPTAGGKTKSLSHYERGFGILTMGGDTSVGLDYRRCRDLLIDINMVVTHVHETCRLPFMYTPITGKKAMMG